MLCAHLPEIESLFKAAGGLIGYLAALLVQA